MINKPDRVERKFEIIRNNRLLSWIIFIVLLLGGLAYFTNTMRDLKNAYDTVHSWVFTKQSSPPLIVRASDTVQNAATKIDTARNDQFSHSNLMLKADATNQEEFGPATGRTYSIGFMSQPPGARVFLKDKRTNIITDSRHELPAGEYDVAFVLNQYDTLHMPLIVPLQTEVIAVLRHQ